MLDLNRTIKLVTGALLDSEATWQSYLPEAGDWKKTAFLLTGPLIVVSAVVAYLLALFTAGGGMFGAFRPTILSTLMTIVTGAIGAGVVAFVFSALAGRFGGKSDFALGLAAATLAFVPGYVGQALTWLPWIGGLLAIGLGIFSLVQLWKIIPIYLNVPESKRAVHFAASLITTIVIMIIVSLVLSPMMPAPQFNPGDSSTGMFGDINRQAALIADVEEDTYTPPADGKMTERQVREFVSIMEVVNKKMSEAIERMEALAEETDEDDELSAKNFSAMMRGMTEAGGISTIEMETVNAAGGNWAEHKWVQETLWTAKFQQQGDEAVEHNFALYEEYADRLTSSEAK